MLIKSRLALSAALILGTASGALADITENKVGDIYPVPVAQRQASGMAAYAMARPATRGFTAQEKALFDRVNGYRW
jgi:hypothetical protein